MAEEKETIIDKSDWFVDDVDDPSIPVIDIDADPASRNWPKRTNDVFFDKNHPQAAKPEQRQSEPHQSKQHGPDADNG